MSRETRHTLIMLAVSPWLGAPLFAWTMGESYLAMVWSMYRGFLPFMAGLVTVLIWRWTKAAVRRWRWRRQRRWESSLGIPTPRHWNCRCRLVPMSAVTSFDEEPKS
jgi:hypothetical protein